MKFCVALISMLLCMYSCNNVVHCSDGPVNPIFKLMNDNYAMTEIKDIDELTNDLANSEILDKELISKYSLNNVIGTLVFEGNEKDTIEHYDNIAKILMNSIAQVKQDYKMNLICREDAEILLNYFNSIRDNAKNEMENICVQNGFQNLESYIENVYTEYNNLYYFNKIG